MMKFIPLSILLFLTTACASEQSPIALNWYARIDHAPGCGERNAALIAGKDTLLCPLDQARFNGDSLVVRSGGTCYFIELQRITDYRFSSQFKTIDCAAFDEYITVEAAGWPRSFQEEEVIEI
jgi:hypothetical protein